MLVPVLLSLDTFPYVRAANLVLLKLYSFVPQNKKISLLQMCVPHLSLFSLFDQRRCWIASLYYFPPFLSSLNHVLDSCYTTFPLPFLFEPRPRFLLYNFPHYVPV